MSGSPVSRACKECAIKVRFTFAVPPIAVPLLSFLLLPAGAVAVRAQIVNIENILAGEPREGVEAALQIGFELKQGNSEYRRMNANGLIRWHGGHQIIQVVLGGAYRTARGNKVEDNALGHLRYGYELSPELRLEALIQIQKDSFIRLQRRVLVGAGVRANIFSSAGSSRSDTDERWRVDFGLIIMHESEILRDSASDPGLRASMLISASWNISATASLGSQIYVQPALQDLDDVRLLGDGSLTVKVLGPLSLQISTRIVYDSRPPLGVKNTDYLLRNTLVLAF